MAGTAATSSRSGPGAAAHGPTGHGKAENEKCAISVTLACTECKRRNYNTTKNKKKQTERLEMSKLLPVCRKHTPHKESK